MAEVVPQMKKEKLFRRGGGLDVVEIEEEEDTRDKVRVNRTHVQYDDGGEVRSWDAFSQQRTIVPSSHKQQKQRPQQRPFKSKRPLPLRQPPHQSQRSQHPQQHFQPSRKQSRPTTRHQHGSSTTTSSYTAKIADEVSFSWFHNKPKRKLIDVRPKLAHQKVGASDHTFSILSYNILATTYIRASYYPWIRSQRILSWSFRSKQLISEICSYDADVLCLQEVETNVFHNFLCSELKQKGGYDMAYFFRRTSLKSQRIDGCAFFFRSSKFRCLGEKVIAFNDYADNIINRTDNIAAFLTLQFLPPETNMSEAIATQATTSSQDSTIPDIELESGPIVVVGNTHLCYRYLEARCLQARVFLKESKELHQEVQDLYPDTKVGLVLCGDFNAGPASSVYKHFEKDGQLTSAYSLLKTGKEEKKELDEAEADQNPSLGSVMHTSFIGTPSMIDYIWVSDELTTTSLLTLPRKILRPNLHLSSDHVALLAHLAC